MELKKYKLGDLCTFINGRAYLQPELQNSGKYKIVRVGNLSGGNNSWYYSDMELEPTKYCAKGDLLYAWACNFGPYIWKGDKTIYHYHIWKVINSEQIDKMYLYYLLKFMTNSFMGCVHGSTMLHITKENMESMEVRIHASIEEQRRIATILNKLDCKIELNRQINDNLEAMAKQLYDYWFVQFDFPNEEGKPYKSSGGAMVWNEDLHMSIPCNWNVCLLSDYIGCNNTGDWGFDEPAEKRSIKVGCIRGADIVKLNNLPIRYIKDNNTSKLLSAWDIVIEVSGGSPTQATGRSAFVTPGVLKRNGGNLTCSNFCHAFTMKDCKASAYFYFMWRMFYDNNNMFNFEGKTSGIKNFMTDTFLANKWLDVPTVLLDLFFERVKVIFEQIDNNIEEINALTKQRDELLPLLMNGQATVNYHLSAFTSFTTRLQIHAFTIKSS